MNTVFYNQEFIRSPPEGFFNSRGFLYGDGVFETMTFQNGSIAFLDDHIARLREAIATIKINTPTYLTSRTVTKITSALCHYNHLNKARVKVIVWRKAGGFFRPSSSEAELLVTTQAHLSAPLVKEPVYFYNTYCKPSSLLSKYKTLSSLPYVLASIDATEKKAADLVLLDHRGFISECLTSNIFFIVNNALHTPSLDCACIDGIVRKQIIRLCEQAGTQVFEGKFTPADLLKADVIFTSNVSGLSVIVNLDGKSMKESHPILSDIQEKLPMI